jgi:hypothetical protein
MKYSLIPVFCLLLSGCAFSQSFVGLSLGPGIHFYNIDHRREDITHVYSKGFYTAGLDFKFGKKLLVVVNPSYLQEIMFYETKHFNHYGGTDNKNLNYFLRYFAFSV